MTGLHALHLLIGIRRRGRVRLGQFHGEALADAAARRSDGAVLALRRRGLDRALSVALPGRASRDEEGVAARSRAAARRRLGCARRADAGEPRQRLSAARHRQRRRSASAIAVVKSAIVVWLFMRLRTAPAMVRIVAATALATLLLLLGLSSVDYATRPSEPAAFQSPRQAPVVRRRRSRRRRRDVRARWTGCVLRPARALVSSAAGRRQRRRSPHGSITFFGSRAARQASAVSSSIITMKPISSPAGRVRWPPA